MHAAHYQLPTATVPKLKKKKSQVSEHGTVGQNRDQHAGEVPPFFLTALFLLNYIPVCRFSVLSQVDGAIVFLQGS